MTNKIEKGQSLPQKNKKGKRTNKLFLFLLYGSTLLSTDGIDQSEAFILMCR